MTRKISRKDEPSRRFISLEEELEIFDRDRLTQWFLTFLKTGNTFGYMKNLRNTKINDPRNKQKHAA